MEIMNIHRIFGHVVAEIIGASIGHPPFEATSGDPLGKTAWMMITAVIIGRQLALRIIGAAEFSTPDHQGIFEEPTLLEVSDQSGRCLVGFLALISNAPGEASVLIPALMEELNETDSTLGQPSGQQAIGGEGAGLFGIVSIELEGGLTLTA